jgi:hypothetical protein
MCADEGVGVRAPGDELVSGPRPKNVSAVFLRTEIGVSQMLLGLAREGLLPGDGEHDGAAKGI